MQSIEKRAMYKSTSSNVTPFCRACLSLACRIVFISHLPIASIIFCKVNAKRLSAPKPACPCPLRPLDLGESPK